MKTFSATPFKWLATSWVVLTLAACGNGTPTATTAPSAANTPQVANTAAPRVSTAEMTTAPSAGNTTAPSATSAPSTSDTPVAAVALTLKLNLNTATAGEFQTIPSVGNRMTREFMEYRPYTTIGQFRREIGKYVDAAQVAEYEKYVFVPVAVNTADAETLKQLPGVDDALAAELIAGRPYATLADFTARLATHLSAEQLAVAESYLIAP